MSFNNLAGFPAFGPRVDATITYNPVSYIPESPIVLPSSLPATAQVQLTMNTASLPIWSPVEPRIHLTDYTFAEKYIVYTIMGFYSGAAVSKNITVYYKSANPSTFSSAGVGTIGAGKYKTICTRYGLTSPALDDIQEYKLYTTDTDSLITFLWAYMVVCPYSPLKMGDVNNQSSAVNLEVDVSNASWIGAESVSAPSAGWDAWKFNMRSADTTALAIAATSNIRQSAYQCATSGYLLNAPNASSTAAVVWENDQTTDNKKHKQPYYPTRIAYTPIL